MNKITGVVASEGIAVGKAYVLPEETELLILAYRLDDKDIDLHIKRLDDAITAAKTQIQHTIDTATAENQTQTVKILTAHLTMLSDDAFISEVKDEIRTNKMNVEYVLKKKVDDLANILNSQDDVYMQARAVDITDTFNTVLYELVHRQQKQKNRFAHIPKGVILFAKEIKPSEAMIMRELQVAGLVTEEGSATSHMAIMARSWNVPMLVGIKPCSDLLGSTDCTVVLDCDEGFMLCDPTSEQIDHYRAIIQEKKSLEERLFSVEVSNENPVAKTADGVPVLLNANIALPDEIHDKKLAIASGIGLFRTEFLVLDEGLVPDEEQQFESYKEVVRQIGTKPVVMRTFDIGADKMIDGQDNPGEKNPMLGWRGVRYSLDKVQVFKAQLRAIVRASHFGNVRILLPMISVVDEIIAVNNLINEVKSELQAEGIPFSTRIPIGIMVEVPSVAIMADTFARYVDFMSIGTNDLTQYVMASDRENVKVQKLATYFNPAVLALIGNIISSQSAIHGCLIDEPTVSMCGEMAGDRLACAVLLGMGLRCFSMQARKIPAMRDFLSKLSVNDAKKITRKIDGLPTAAEVRSMIKSELNALNISV